MTDRNNFQEILPHESYVIMPESIPNNEFLVIKKSDVLDNDRSVNLSKSVRVGSLDFGISTDHSLFASSTNISESDIALVPDKLNNINDEASEPNVIVCDESNDYAIIDHFEHRAPENDDDCFVVASTKSTTPVKLGNRKSDKSKNGVSIIEFVDLTQDESEETKFQDSFVHEFTKDTRLCILLDVIPDADPDFLMRKVNEFKTDEDLQLFVFNALETQNYPKTSAIKNILLKKTGKSVKGPESILNEDVSRSYFLKSPNSSISQQSAFKNYDLINSHFVDLDHSTTSGISDMEKNRQDPSIPTTTIPHTVTSINAAEASATRAQSYTNSSFAVVNMGCHSYQRHIQPKTVVDAKPHTVTSQEASYEHTSSNIPHTVSVSSRTDVIQYQDLDPGFSIQDIRASQQGIKSLVSPLSTYIPTHSVVSSTQTYNDNPHNVTVNVPARPFTSTLQVIAPNTPAPHATYIDATLPPGTGFPQDDFFQNDSVWLPLSINIFNHTKTTDTMRQRRRRHYQEYIRLHRYGRLNAIPRNLGTDMMENFAVSLADITKPMNRTKECENKIFNLLTDILTWGDPEFLRSEANKLKNDEDVEKFLIRAIANEELWNHCVTAENPTQKNGIGLSDNKYKILLELLPDASPTFLKRESAKLKNDEEVHEFAIKLSREQIYPKRKNPSSSLKVKSNKRKSEISDTEPDPKYLTLLDMLPDADPDFLLQESKMLGNPDDLQKFVLKAVEDNTYPKRDQFLERLEYHKQWKKYIEHFNIKEFLQVIPNPVKFFYFGKVNSKNPLDVPAKFLQHRYRRKVSHTFGYFFNAAKCNLTKTCDNLDVHFQTKPRKYGAWDQKTIFSTSILQEIAFIQNKKEIAHYLLFKEEIKLEAYEKAKTEGTLLECSCCYDDKLSEDMTSCLAGHLYCLNCIKRGSEVVIGNGGTKFPCYSEGCKEEFSFDILKTVLNPEVFSRMLIRKQYEEVNAAGIPGLETCSFCEFCSIPAAEDKLFRCLNPSCMKVTCRSCKKLDHLPLSCEEFTQKETRQKMQSYVEDKMTEALVRTCWQCGTKFVKENGCNMMQCKCGAKMCYYCRQPVQDYHHFAEGKCGKFLDTTAHDEAAVRKVGKKAKREIEAANPGYRLPNDPTKSLMPKKTKHKTPFHEYF